MLNVQGKRAVVTGGGSGIGFGIVKLFHNAEISTTVFEIDESKESVVQPYAQFLTVDVTDETQVQQAFDQIGSVDILVNNAGTGTLSSIVEMEVEEWHEVMEVNLKGVFLCTKHAARGMIRKNIHGSIVNITSINAVIPFRGISHYCASKGGVMMFTKAAAQELGPFGIRVNAVGPSFVETGITEDIAELPGVLDDHTEKSVFNRLAQPEDIAKVVLFLASDLANWVTGQTIYADGGTLLTGPKSYLTAFEEALEIDFRQEWKK